MALESLKEVARKIAGSSSIDKKFVEEMVREIQRALIKADVNVRQVKEISDAIKKRALSEDVLPASTLRSRFSRSFTRNC